MTAVCFDISSGGVSAAIFDAKANIVRRVESEWNFVTAGTGAATLSVEMILDRFKIVLQDLKVPESVETIVIGCFMHNCVPLDADDQPLTPVFTWLDQRGKEGVTYVRSRVGDAFHERTGCRYHPMFPVFKLASLYVRDSALMARAKRVVSAKTFLIHRLTQAWIEDYGMASSSGLFNLETNNWDTSLLALLGLTPGHFPPVARRTDIGGRVTREAASQFGLPRRNDRDRRIRRRFSGERWIRLRERIENCRDARNVGCCAADPFGTGVAPVVRNVLLQSG